jgi:hypothetical protein
MLVFVLSGHSKGQTWVKAHYYEHHNDIVGGPADNFVRQQIGVSS